MNFYNEWQNTKVKGCQCPWCRGEFHASTANGTADWTECYWNAYAGGNKIRPENACCANKIKASPVANVPAAPVQSKTGFNCKICNLKNDYASANQKDGSYLCFNCRQ